jgi:hypothetical protein
MKAFTWSDPLGVASCTVDRAVAPGQARTVFSLGRKGLYTKTSNCPHNDSV